MTEYQRGEVIVLADPVALADEGARRVVEVAQAAIADHGRFRVALSGGSTPRAMYERLARAPLSEAVDWAKVDVFWGDERFVPPDDPESCFLMARETLLAHVPIPAANIYPFPTVGSTPEAAAQSYAATLSSVFSAKLPRFDLILLGIGPDAHTASLFPGHPEPVAPSEDLVVAVHDSPKPPPTRLSLTYKVLNAAAYCLFVVAGADKAAALHGVLDGPRNRAQLPAQGVQPANGHLLWLVDQKAAAQL